MSSQPPRAYLRFAILLANLFVFLVALNVLLIFANKQLGKTAPAPLPPQLPPGSHVIIPSPLPPPDDPNAGRPTPNRKRDPDTMESFDTSAFAGLSMDQVNGMIDDMNDFGRAGSSYLPWVEFGPPQFKSQYVNIVTDGPEFPYRLSARPAAQGGGDLPVITVYVLGGSTTFGSRVADDWTMPSYLWDELQRKSLSSAHPCRIELVNWGRTWYYSSQELVLLRRLLRSGHKPDVVVFLDGLNDVNNWCSLGTDKPVFSDKLAEIYLYNQQGKDWLAQYGWIPMVKFAFLVRQRLTPPPLSIPILLTQEQVDERAGQILDCYRQNTDDARQLCDQNGIRCYFFWQPVPFVKYDLRLHRATPKVSPGIVAVFEQVYARLRTSVPRSIDVDDLLEAWGHRKAFVDMVHYNPGFNQFLAARMAAWIDVSKPARKPSDRP